MSLTAKQLEALAILATAPRSSWHFGSTTVSVLRKAGLIATTPGKSEATITDAGRALLAGPPRKLYVAVAPEMIARVDK